MFQDIVCLVVTLPVKELNIASQEIPPLKLLLPSELLRKRFDPVGFAHSEKLGYGRIRCDAKWRHGGRVGRASRPSFLFGGDGRDAHPTLRHVACFASRRII